MTTKEFSNQFDILYNLTSNAAPNVSEYEKSVFLTEAQEELVLSLYSGNNPFGDSLEETEQLRRYLSSLVTSVNISPTSATSVGLTASSKLVTLPLDMWFITYEKVKFTDGKEAEVSVITQDEFNYAFKNPFKCPKLDRYFRLDLDGNKLEIIGPNTGDISFYYLRYFKTLTPIILQDLDGINATINGLFEETQCSLNNALHNSILKLAVQKAVQAYIS